MSGSGLALRLQSLAVFRALRDDPVMAALEACLLQPTVDRYAALVSLLYQSGTPALASHVARLADDSENPYIRLVGAGGVPSPELEEALTAELDILQEAASLTPADLRAALDYGGYLPAFPVEEIDLPARYRRRIRDVNKLGYGLYAKHRMFHLSPAGKIVPVLHPDGVRLASLVDYEREKQIILDNTRALLEGKPAANILLTGDAGTGKSSTVKAVVNELAGQGLRIVEVRKEQLHLIPELMDELNANPLKFILFLDDLSFQKGDDDFSALKAILEGSVAARSRSVVIYATSNRRHLVKESFSDRDGDDVHRNDTLQELVSLSERFGIQITFQKPDKATYLNIVRRLATERGLDLPQKELDERAERFALSRGGRSARAAAQFVDGLTVQKA